MNAQEVEMVFRGDEKGGGWHEPPYTWEEEMELYRRMGGAKSLTIYRSQRPGAADKQDQPKPPPQEENEL
jgi:hypothetical protein